MSDRRFLAFTPFDGGYIGSGVSPHSATVRYSYTVPAGRMAVLESAFVETTRATAPTTAGQARCYVVITRNGESSLIILEATIFSSTVGVTEWATLGTPITLVGGDAVTLRTIDTSTGGTCNYTGSVMISQY